MTEEASLQPTLHVEICLKSISSREAAFELCHAVTERLYETYAGVEMGQSIEGFDGIDHAETIELVEIAGYTGPLNPTGCYMLGGLKLDVKAYLLKPEIEPDPRRRISQPDDDSEKSPAHIMALPNVSLHGAWDSLVFDDPLPARLLRYLVRMIDIMSRSDISLRKFNWNRLCLLHGPPGSGKSTLCRALAQKLSIRLGDRFHKSILVEIDTNAMLSKWFGESGKQIGKMFDRVREMAHDRLTLVCVVMDEVETIAGSRLKSTSGGDCLDGLRATNQLLTALDRLRNLPNVVVLCTSNLIDAIDPAFVDRVDIKQLIPCPSPAAIYGIFRSCLNEMIRGKLITTATTKPVSESLYEISQGSDVTATPEPEIRPELENLINQDNHQTIPTLEAMRVLSCAYPDPRSPKERLWTLAQKCEGISGRTLRRLPMVGLTMYTWGADCSVQDAVGALEKTVEQELAVKRADVKMEED